MSPETMDETRAAMRAAQAAWWAMGLKGRLRVVRRFRGLLAERGEEIAREIAGASVCRDGVGGLGMTLAAEVIPLADAAKWLERQAGEVLGERKVGVAWGRGGRPLWLWGTRSVVRRVPWGVVLVIGAGNYPLMLAGVQAMQALAAGNAVVLKPGRAEGGGLVAAGWLERLWREAGLPAGVFTAIGESVEEVEGWMGGGSGGAAQNPSASVGFGVAGRGGGVDKVVLTGSSATGRAVMRRCAETLTPVSLELSGVDGCVVLPGADIEMAAKAIAWGLRLNNGATCIAPRRVLVHRSLEERLGEALRAALEGVELTGLYPGSAERCAAMVGEALEGGAVLWSGERDTAEAASHRVKPWVVGGVTREMRLAVEDSFGPTVALMGWETEEELMGLEAACPYGLGVSVFGPAGKAERVAGLLAGAVGSVCVNDLIAPTADPRLPFGGTGESGFGVTRGVEGLIGMTRPVSVTVRGGKGRPHYAPVSDKEVRVLGGYLRVVHAVGWRGKAKAIRGLVRGRKTGV